jgi:F0F1-type ATP synthase epsilon subunit
MMDKIAFDLVSPERLLLSEQADMVTVPGSDGYFGVLTGHMPLISTFARHDRRQRRRQGRREIFHPRRLRRGDDPTRSSPFWPKKRFR